MRKACVCRTACAAWVACILLGCAGGQPIEGLTSLTDANAAFLRGEYARAVGLYEEALDANPGLVEARNNMALCYLAEGQFGLANQAIQDAVRAGVQPAAGVQMNRATIAYSASGATQLPIEILQTASRGAMPANLRAQLTYNLGWLYDEDGQLGKARTKFEETLALAGVGVPGGPPGTSVTDSRVWQKATVALGYEWARQGEPGRARALFQSVVNLHNASPEAKEAALTNLHVLDTM